MTENEAKPLKGRAERGREIGSDDFVLVAEANITLYILVVQTQTFSFLFKKFGLGFCLIIKKICNLYNRKGRGTKEILLIRGNA